MCIINDITHFVKNGVSVLRSASSIKYKENSPEIEALKHEFFSTPSNRRTDMENLRKDRDNVAHDVRRAFENLKLSNGRPTEYSGNVSRFMASLKPRFADILIMKFLF